MHGNTNTIIAEKHSSSSSSSSKQSWATAPLLTLLLEWRLPQQQSGRRGSRSQGRRQQDRSGT